MSTYSPSLAANQSKPNVASLAPNAHWLLRLGFASVFLFHGIEKFAAPVQFAEMMQLPLFVAILVAFAEIAGGLAVLIGGAFAREWVTRLGGLVILPVMIGAITMVHWGQWSFVPTDTHPMGGMEFQVVLLLIGLYFLVRGNGDYAR